MTREEFEQAVQALLDSVPAMTLATWGPDAPWATDVYVARCGYDLVFFSSPDSRHCRNLAANPACAATLHPQVPAPAWTDIRGLQMQGVAGPAAGPGEIVRGTAAYLVKFPFARELMRDPSEAARRMAKVSLHVFRPSRIRYLDNSLGFGARFTMSLEGGAPVGVPEPEGGTRTA
jgi:uncharacterized protein